MKFIRPVTFSPTESSYTAGADTIGTYFDQAGVLQDGVSGTPRRTWDPSALGHSTDREYPYVGLLYERESTNLLLNTDIGTTSYTAATSAVTATVTNTTVYTLSFRGVGKIVLTGAISATLDNSANVTTFDNPAWEWTTWTTNNIVSGKYYKIATSPTTANFGLSSTVVGTSFLATTSGALDGSGTTYVRKDSMRYIVVTATASGSAVATLSLATSSEHPIRYVQLEAYPYAITNPDWPPYTSYIRTKATTVQRSADSISDTTYPKLVYASLLENSPLTYDPDYGINEWSNSTLYNNGMNAGNTLIGTPSRAYLTTVGSKIHTVFEYIGTATVAAPAVATIRPDLDILKSAVPSWLEIRPTNRWGIFDGQIGTVSKVVGLNTGVDVSMTYILRPGMIDSLALFELDATYVYVSVVLPDSRNIIYSAQFNVADTKSIGSWYNYFYETAFPKDTLVATMVDTALLNIPSYTNAIVEVSIRKKGSLVDGNTTSASCGVLVLGMSTDLGHTQTAPNVGIVDYSRKETDAFGYTSVTKRRYSKRMSVKVMLKSTMVDAVAAILAQYRSTPVVWVGAEDLYTSLIIYGFYKDWDITIDNILYSSCNIQVEGLT